jgi:hypothetical protein
MYIHRKQVVEMWIWFNCLTTGFECQAFMMTPFIPQPVMLRWLSCLVSWLLKNINHAWDCRRDSSDNFYCFLFYLAAVAYLLIYSDHYSDTMLQDKSFIFLQFQNCWSQSSSELQRDIPNVMLGPRRDPFILTRTWQITSANFISITIVGIVGLIPTDHLIILRKSGNPALGWWRVAQSSVKDSNPWYDECDTHSTATQLQSSSSVYEICIIWEECPKTYKICTSHPISTWGSVPGRWNGRVVTTHLHLVSM